MRQRMRKVNINVHPLVRFSEEQFDEYLERAMKVDDKSLNKNSCNKQRNVSNPYVSFKAVKPTKEWGESAEIRVLKIHQSPKALKELSSENNARVLVAVKSENTYGNWEYGDMYFWQLAEHILSENVEELQRDVDYGMYEWRMSIYHRSFAEQIEEAKALEEAKQQVSQIIGEMLTKNVPFSKLKERFIKGLEEQENRGKYRDKTWDYRSEDEQVNSHIAFLCDSFHNMEHVEVAIITAFLEKAIVRFKGEQIERIQGGDRQKRIKHSDMKELVCQTGVIDIIDGFRKELDYLEEQYKEHFQDAQNYGGYDGNEIAKA